MIVPAYTPGAWFAVVTDGSVALLPPTTPPATVQGVWASLRASGALTEQLQVLLSSPLASLPPFALVSVEGGQVHAVVRGGVEVEVTAAGGTKVLSAAQVSTWSEEIVTGAHGVAVRVTGEPAPAEPGPALPVLSAVVRASAVEIDLRSADQHAAEPASAAASADPLRPDSLRPVSVPPASEPPARSQPAQSSSAPSTSAEPEPPVEPERPAEPEPVAEVEQPAAPEQPVEPEQPATPTQPEQDDHDGLTVLSSDVVALRRQLPEWAGDAVPGPFAVPAPQAAPPAKIQLSSGLVVSLNRPVLLGRAPQVSRVANDRLPRLVTVSSPNQDISRTHAEVRMDGEDVLVTDLRSTNGVLLLRQDTGPQRLHPGEPTVVEPGVVVDLGEGVTFVVERGT